MNDAQSEMIIDRLNAAARIYQCLVDICKAPLDSSSKYSLREIYSDTARRLFYVLPKDVTHIKINDPELDDDKHLEKERPQRIDSARKMWGLHEIITYANTLLPKNYFKDHPDSLIPTENGEVKKWLKNLET